MLQLETGAVARMSSLHKTQTAFLDEDLQMRPLLGNRVKLGSRERPRGVVYGLAPAVKIAQLGVDRRFAGCGLGKLLVGYAVQMAVMFRRRIGCRYVTLDARTEELVRWYEAQGFVRNKEEQKLRVVDAERRGRMPEEVPVSLRFDLRERSEIG